MAEKLSHLYNFQNWNEWLNNIHLIYLILKTYLLLIYGTKQLSIMTIWHDFLLVTWMHCKYQSWYLWRYHTITEHKIIYSIIHSLWLRTFKFIWFQLMFALLATLICQKCKSNTRIRYRRLYTLPFNPRTFYK